MTQTRERLYALDAFRGLTIATMILVNTPGSWAHIYPPLAHADWHGCTPTDLVFPFFLFIVGVAMWFSFSKYDHHINTPAIIKVLKRTFLIFLIGLLLTAFPFYNKDYSHLRILGVFQRIALAYGGAGLIVLILKEQHLKYVNAVLLLGYWWALWHFGGGDPYGLETNLVRRIDLAILGPNHVWHGKGLPFDPEGLLSTLPAIVTVTLGYFTGKLITTSESRMILVGKMFFIGTAMVLVGLLWDPYFPINKSIWTSSYVMFTAGAAQLVLGIMILAVDIWGYKKAAQPLVVFGTNPLFVFVLSIIWVKILFMIKIAIGPETTVNAYRWLYLKVFMPIGGELNGSLLFALTHIVIFWLILRILYKRNIIIKI